MIIPEANKRAVVTHLESTRGMMITPGAISRRHLAEEYITLLQWVPGHGGDVWWCQHADGTVAPYCITELDEV